MLCGFEQSLQFASSFKNRIFKYIQQKLCILVEEEVNRGILLEVMSSGTCAYLKGWRSLSSFMMGLPLMKHLLGYVCILDGVLESRVSRVWSFVSNSCLGVVSTNIFPLTKGY
ncbi:hypothetical protein GOP47_0028719 [Adiantum capillus-veneris]|nr:hypothetical protein GOP47_0028719 [Adiantum capillus-veneris]